MTKLALDDLTLTPVKTVTVGDLAYMRLKQAIVAGQFKPSERLVESAVAARLQVSRTPLREAFTLLEREGLLERLPRGGMIVPPFSATEIEELYDIRAALESLAASKAAKNVAEAKLSSEELAELEAMQDLLAQQVQNPAREEEDSRPYTTNFHLLVHRLSHNQRCIDILENVMTAMRRYRAFAPQYRSREGLKEHRKIIAAIAAGEPDRAEFEMRKHITESGVLYKEIIERATSNT